MKILILSSKVPFPPNDGGAIATLSIAEGLAENNNDVSMLCMNTSKHPFNVAKIPKILKEKIKFYSVDHNTKIRFFGALLNLFFSHEPYNAIRFKSKKFKKKLIEVLHVQKPQIVQLEGPYLGYYLDVIRENSKAKVSLRAHNVENEIWQRKALNSANPFLRFYYTILSSRIRKLEKKVMDNSDFLIPISDRDRKQLIQLSNIPNFTIPTGLNPYRYPTPKDPEFPTLFYIGALDWMPNQEAILWFIEEVFVKLVKQLKFLKLNIAGRNAPEWLMAKFREYQSLGIVFHGEVNNAYVFMNRYAIFVSPLLTGSGIRIKILEGMMMRRAVVASSIAAEGIPVSDRKNILIADSAEEMSDIIFDLCKNKDKYLEIAANSRIFVLEKFNNLAVCKSLSDYYSTQMA
jgi:glycosyltransferase involved in cell wall biosynthesis